MAETSRRRVVHRIGPAALAFVFGLSALGCSSDSEPAGRTSASEADEAPTSERAVLTDALDVTTAVDTATVTFSLGFEGDGRSASAVTEGRLDFTTGRGTSTTTDGTAELSVIIDGERAWMRTDTPEFDALLPTGTTWIGAPTTDLVERGVISVNPDVSWAPLYFLAGAEDVEVDDTGRTFTFTVDPEAVRPALTPAQRRAFDATTSGLTDPDAVTDVTGTVTLDDSGRIIEYRLDVQLDPRVSPEGDSFVMELTLSDIDVPVTVDPPAADVVADVADHPGLLDQLAGPGPGY